jgi:hypothetical protein
MANIASQSQLNYMALQYVVNAMREIAEKPNELDNIDSANIDEHAHDNKQNKNYVENKQSKHIKKGIYQIFDLISKSHINTRLWMNARKDFVFIMSNQLSDLGKPIGQSVKNLAKRCVLSLSMNYVLTQYTQKKY